MVGLAGVAAKNEEELVKLNVVTRVAHGKAVSTDRLAWASA